MMSGRDEQRDVTRYLVPGAIFRRYSAKLKTKTTLSCATAACSGVADAASRLPSGWRSYAAFVAV